MAEEVGRIGLLSVSASYAGVYPWFYALDLWEMDCWGRSATPILSSQHFSHYVLLIRWVGGTRAWTGDLSVRSPELYRLSYTRAKWPDAWVGLTLLYVADYNKISNNKQKTFGSVVFGTVDLRLWTKGITSVLAFWGFLFDLNQRVRYSQGEILGRIAWRGSDAGTCRI